MEKDFDWGVFFEDQERFADFVNQEGFAGRTVVSARQVQEADPRLYMKPGRGKRQKKMEKFRDSVRKVVLGTNFVIVDVESQENIDYSYPPRDLGYVYGEYERQAARIRNKNRREDKKRQDKEIQSEGIQGEGIQSEEIQGGGMSGKVILEKGLQADELSEKYNAGEYLYHFRRGDRLRPAVVFLLYSGKEEWTGPTDLYGILDMENIPEELKGKIQNHKINLIDIHRMTEKQLSGYRSDVGKIFRLIRYSEEKEKLSEVVNSDVYYKNMPEDAYRVAANYTHAIELKNMEKYRTETEGYNMCTAIRELIEEGKAEGKAEGRAEGREELLVELVCKKLRKQKEAEEIAEELEEDVKVIRAICEAARPCAPDYNKGEVFERCRRHVIG